MPIRHSIWHFGALKEGQSDSGTVLEDMSVAAPGTLSQKWMTTPLVSEIPVGMGTATGRRPTRRV